MDDGLCSRRYENCVGLLLRVQHQCVQENGKHFSFFHSETFKQSITSHALFFLTSLHYDSDWSLNYKQYERKSIMLGQTLCNDFFHDYLLHAIT